MSAPRSQSAAPRAQACQVLHQSPEGHRLWRFHTAGAGVQFHEELLLPPDTPLPATATRRGWRQWIQPRLNLAWLPAADVFLRVLHLPPAPLSELPAIIELQLEKLCPLPVNQVVWSYEVFPTPDRDDLTVILLIANRTSVESHLAGLDKQRYTTDRLELPLLHQILNTPNPGDGTWLYVTQEGTRTLCLAAWHHGGRLQQLTLLQALADSQAPTRILAQLTRVAWAGEVEGWLTTPPAWHLVTDPDTCRVWEVALQEWAPGSFSTHPAPAARDTAQLAALRATRGQSTVNLLPAEFATRYRQELVDQLWMRGLAALVVVYLLGITAYYALVRVESYRRDTLRREVAQLAAAYTNALTLKERVRVFQEQAGLKYAALECWRIASELLPPEVTLEAMNFQGGERLFLSGTVASEHQEKVTQFRSDLRKARLEGVPVFDEDQVGSPQFTPRGPNLHRWDFTATFKAAWLE